MAAQTVPGRSLLIPPRCGCCLGLYQRLPAVTLWLGLPPRVLGRQLAATWLLRTQLTLHFHC
eukprot:3888773-Prorocentrum_lima.AAC.1